MAKKFVQPRKRKVNYRTTQHHKFYSLFVVSDCELKVARNNTLLLVITRCVARELENLSGEVLEDSREVDFERYLATDTTMHEK